MSFKATFFDGKTSKAHNVIIYPNASHWKISFVNQQPITSDIIWKIDEIQRSEVYTKGLVSFSYGKTFPFQKIESKNEQFINYINNSNHAKLNSKVDVLLHKSVKKSILILLTFIFCVTATMYFFIIPNVAVSFAKNLSKPNVIAFGDHVYKTLATDLDIDTIQTKRLQDFVNTLTIKTEFPIDIKVVNSNVLNAFAISGGKIIVNSYLLQKLENEHQLTALIGHEISHVEKRHVLKNVAKSLSSSIFMSVLFGDVNGVTTVIGENAQLFLQLSYSRALEKEADLFGLEIMKQNGLDLQGMPTLFQIFKKEINIKKPTYLSSHPDLEDRINYTKKIADQQHSFKENKVLKIKWNAIKNHYTKDLNYKLHE